MSRDVRAALELAQARLRELEARPAPEEPCPALAAALRREADGLEALLGRVEHRALAREGAGRGERVIFFSFSVLFVLPVVAMVGFSAGGALRREPAAAVGLLVAGAVLLAVAFSARARGAVRHAVSPDFRLVRDARRTATRLERW